MANGKKQGANCMATKKAKPKAKNKMLGLPVKAKKKYRKKTNRP